MINLCPTTYELAGRIENFSEWVREQLKKAAPEAVEEQEHMYKCGCCTLILTKGNMHRPKCPNCSWIMTYVKSQSVGTE